MDGVAKFEVEAFCFLILFIAVFWGAKDKPCATRVNFSTLYGSGRRGGTRGEKSAEKIGKNISVFVFCFPQSYPKKRRIRMRFVYDRSSTDIFFCLLKKWEWAYR